MAVKHPCAGKSSTDVSHVLGKRECARAGTAFVDGEWWCWQHDPRAMQKKLDKRLSAARKQIRDAPSTPTCICRRRTLDTFCPFWIHGWGLAVMHGRPLPDLRRAREGRGRVDDCGRPSGARSMRRQAPPRMMATIAHTTSNLRT